MEKKNQDLIARRSLLTKASVAAVAGLGVTATSACAQLSPTPADVTVWIPGWAS
jgi:hypothetical protein